MKNQLVIYRSVTPITAFRAPDDNYAARVLWLFLVEHLKPGLRVALFNASFPEGMIRDSGHEFGDREYREVMSVKRSMGNGNANSSL